MKEIIADSMLVAYCGLYCGSCRRYLGGKCPGCLDNARAEWCKVRTCCIENKYLTCADCATFEDPKDCKKFNNAVSKIIGFVLRSDRAGCIRQVKRLGLEGHAENMASSKRPSIRRS